MNNRQITECKDDELSLGSDLSDGYTKDYAEISDWKDTPIKCMERAALKVGVEFFCYSGVVSCLRGIDASFKGSRMELDGASDDALVAAELHLWAKKGRKYITYGRCNSGTNNKNDRLKGDYEVWVSRK